MRQEIENFRLEREIPYLLHFTREENLPSILEHGLAPRSEIDCGAVGGLTNDELRLDNRRSFNCLSIAFPNAPMFYRFKADHPEIEWPILVIQPQILARQHALFCWQNAASNEISQKEEADLASLDSFRGLFDERDGHATRQDQFLKMCDPTNVQAEVLVQGRITPDAIYGVIYPSVPCQQRNIAYAGNRKTITSGRRGYYGTRQYFRQWGDGKNG